MSSEYKPITKDQLIEIIEKINNKISDNSYPSKLSQWVKIWRPIITQFANDEATYFNKRNDIENFPLQYKFEELKFSILFNIDQIIQDIDQDLLQIDTFHYYAQSHEPMYTYSNYNNMVLKDRPPILVYLPCSENGQIYAYFAIDGNHRISYYKDNKIPFTSHFIPFNHLQMQYFLNINSWLGYHLISSHYYFLIFSDDQLSDYQKGLENFLNQ